MPTSGLNIESLVVIILDIIRLHQLRIICCLDEKGLLGNGDVAEDARRIRRKFSRLQRIPTQVHRFTRLAKVSDRDCVDNLRMDRNCFGRLCILLRERGGLEDGKYVLVEEQVAMFLCVLSHHKKIGLLALIFGDLVKLCHTMFTLSSKLLSCFMNYSLLNLFLWMLNVRILDGNGSRYNLNFNSCLVVYFFYFAAQKNTCLMWHVGLFGRFRRYIY